MFGPVYSYAYDSMGRLQRMSDQANTAWVNDVTYGPANELLQMQANGFTENRTYNANLQLVELVSGTNVHLKYNYSATQNNGQIGSQQDVISGETISYQYDSLKRLIQASATGDPSGSWSEAMSYDGFGNLTQKTGSNAPVLSMAVDPATNRMQTNASYDANGNLTAYAGDGYSYDLRNRLVQANPLSGGTVLYGYDTTNHRVYKGAYNNGSYSAEEIYFYGVEGHKYGAWQVNPSSGVLLQASVTKQWFGSRLVSPEDRLGSKGKYFAFGEERANISPANPLNDQEKFATYTRDSATGLNYANQRYYSSTIGRFTRPDPFGGSAHPGNPQSWNRYAYVSNDPINRRDRNGLDEEYFDGESSAIEQSVDNSGGGGGGEYIGGDGSDPSYSIYTPPVEVTADAPPPIPTEDVPTAPLSNTTFVDPSTNYLPGCGSSNETCVDANTGISYGNPSVQGMQQDVIAESLILGLASAVQSGIIDSSEATLSSTSSAPASTYIDTTNPGALIPNITTNVTADQAAANLQANGFSMSVSADGQASIFTSPSGARYIIRPSNSAPGGKAADFIPAGSGATLKINFGQ